MNELDFVDTTFRDGNQSLWAIGMTAGMILPVAEQMDSVGFKAIELMSTAQFRKCLFDLNENPWERIRLVAQRVRRTPLNLMAHISITTFGTSPMSIQKLWYERMAANGLKRVTIINPSNDMKFKLPRIVPLIKNAGLKVAVGLVFSISPKHTDEYYAQKTRDAAKMKPDMIYLKDPVGLLTPERIRTLVPVIFQNNNGLPFELHSHCTTGLAPLCYLEAIKLGVKTVHTSVPPLANGSGQPSVYNIAKNARHIGYTPNINEELARPVTDHFTYIAKREGLPIGVPLEYDAHQYVHQIPGGVISTLKWQLSRMKMVHRLAEVIEESIQVRKDLGYPIMVTPFSQHVVSQASINVMLGERYTQVIDEIVQYAVGFWGKEPSDAIDQNLMDRIMSLPRAKEFAGWEAPERTIKEIRQKYGGPGIADDELILRYIGSEEEIKHMQAAGPIKEYPTPTTQTPLVTLIQELVKQKDVQYIRIHKGSLSLSLSSGGNQRLG